MGDTANNSTPTQDPPQKDGQASGTGDSEPQAKYTEEAHQKILSDALTIKGREHKTAIETIEGERDDATTKLGHATEDLTEAKTRNTDLQSQLDNAAAAEPDKFKSVEKEKDLIHREALLKQGNRDLQANIQKNDKQLAKANEIEAGLDLIEVAKGFEKGDAKELKDKAALLGIAGKDKLESLAGTMWEKKKEGDPAPVVNNPNPDSLKNNGGSQILTKDEKAVARYPNRFKQE